MGEFATNRYLACRDSCKISLSTGDAIVIHKDKTAKTCPTGRGLLLTYAMKSCPSYQSLFLTDELLPATIYHNKEVGYYLRYQRHNSPAKLWHIR